MIASGAGVKVVQQQLGHRTATMTLDRYTHLFPDELDALSSALDGLRARTPADLLRTPGYGRVGKRSASIAADLRERWWGGQGSNLRPADYESAALTD